MYDVVDSDVYQNVIIYPAGNKVTTVEPYLTGYKYLGKCCEHVKLVIVIGYSFRDYDVLASLLKAREANDNLCLILVTPESYSAVQSIPFDDRIGWVYPLPEYFGGPSGESKYLTEIERWLVTQLEK